MPSVFRVTHKMAIVAISLLVLSLTLPAEQPAAVPRVDADSDGDGLSDFHEVHKYRTDPNKKDTAGRGAVDGDWNQRREFSYSVRAVIRLLPPYNLKAMNDDYQDVLVLAENKHYVELEVVSYPFTTNADAIEGNPNWKHDCAGMKEYLEAGVSTNWDEGMRQDLLRQLGKAGIDPNRLTDKDLVQKVSSWLYATSNHKNMFCTYYVHFPEGKPAVFPGLEEAFNREKGDPTWTAPQQFAHELLGKEMFANKTYGTCTSAAVYQCTVLRALGLPTRIIVTIPLVDASDEAQVALTEKLAHHQVRRDVRHACLAMGGSFSAHTYCEVYVGGRWRRLNGTKLGQNVLDPSFLGLMIHVHTFRDLSEANLAATWGKRFVLREKDDVFRHNNPYRTTELSDHFGKHGTVPNPPVAAKEHRHITLTKAYWFGSPDTPELVRNDKNLLTNDGAGHLLVHGEEWFDNAGDYLQYKAFMKKVDRNFVFRAKGQPDVKGYLSMNFWTHASRGVRELEVIIPTEEYQKMTKGVACTIHPVNGNSEYQWRVKEGVSIARD